MATSQSIPDFRKTDDTEPRVFRLYIALFPMGSGSLCHWGLVLKDGTGAIEILDVNDLGGSREREVRDFVMMRKTHLKMICEIASVENDEGAGIFRATAAAEELPASQDSYFCRTWVINVLRSLRRNGIRLCGEPEMIQRAIQQAIGEFDMRYDSQYHVVAPGGDWSRR
ncbi:hypothetical protein F5Y14DRAFT_455457 [Nemania sp. NC0429]|nr:hypothetical protein F5Y14DRAFT_455457 [Nemania sp. NC0429]